MTIENLPKRLHYRVYTLYINDNYNEIFTVFAEHNVVGCGGCTNNQVLKEWFEYWIKQQILNTQPQPEDGH